MKALGCGFLVGVASYHISGVSYCTAKDHAEYHAKDLKGKDAPVSEFQITETDGKHLCV